jgi:alpha-galactosidase
MTDDPAQPWQPHDRPVGELRRQQVPTGLSRSGVEVILEITAESELAAEVLPAAPGVAEIRLRPVRSTVVRAAWQLPATDLVTYWSPDGGTGLPPFWARPRTTALERGAPVGAVIDAADRAACTFAVGEAVRPVRIRTGVVEETGEYGFWVEQEADPATGLVLRLDLSGRHFADALAGVAGWWSELYPAEPAPDAARRPVYSTWYAMQQHVSAASVERQAGPAAELGCTMIIVDDGWHSADRGRGYGHVGEWEPSPAAFGDLTGHVAAVRRDGLDYLLWYALPFVGRQTALWPRVEPYLLAVREDLDTGVVDPRYPFIRKLITDRLSRAVTEWGMDGLKIDFIDQFAVDDPPDAGAEADCRSVTEGLDRLLAELHDRLRSGSSAAPMVELRQPYVSPGLWRHATMIRAGDCPLSPTQNRRSTVDLRLIAGPLAVHADMMMWHPSESPERVAVQLINALFAVPQISVDLTEQTPEQLDVLRFWLGFVTEQAEVLQRGRLVPSRPDLAYPIVAARGAGTEIIGRYAPLPIEVPDDHRLLVANADASTAVTLIVGDHREVIATVWDCRGREVSRDQVRLSPGPLDLTVPVGGLLEVVPA